MGLIKFCLRNALLMNLLTAFVVVIGTIKVLQMNKEAFPSIDFDVVQISTVYPGASPKEVELYVTDLVEDELQQVDGIDKVESTSIESYSNILIYLDPERTPSQKNKTTTDVQRAVDRIKDLPEALPNPPLVNSIDSGDMPILEISLSGPLTYDGLHGLAETLSDRLEEIADIKEVPIRGDRAPEYWIEVNTKAMERYNVGLSLIISRLQSRSVNLPAGVMKTEDGDILIRTVGEFKDAEEVGDLILRSNDAGRMLRLSQVGEVRRTFEQESRQYRSNGEPSINLLVNKKASGDIIELVEAAKQITEDFQSTHQDLGLRVNLMNDISVFVKNRLGVLLSNGYIGIALVLVVLLLFLSKGIAIVTAAGMPIAFLACLMIMGYSGYTINLISMFGLVIVLGMLVDDAIIVAENIWQHYEMGSSPWEAAFNGTQEVFWPVTATILTTIAAFSPLMMVSGIFGKFITILPEVVIIALVASLIEAMTVLPTHAYDVLKFKEKRKARSLAPNHPERAAHEPIDETADPKTTPLARLSEPHTRPALKKSNKKSLMASATNAYGNLLGRCLKWRYFFLAGISALLVATIFFTKTQMELILFPAEGIESFFIKFDLPPATALSTTSEKLRPIEAKLNQLDRNELTNTVTYIGIQQADPLDPLTKRGSNHAQIQVFLTPERDRERSADQIIEALRTILQPIARAQQFTDFSFARVRTGPPVGKPVAIRVQGEDLGAMALAADEVQKELTKIGGVTDISHNFAIGKEEFRVVVDDEAAARSLLTVRDVALHIRAAIEGQIATHLREEGEQIPLRVRYTPEDRLGLDALINSKIINQAGYLVPIAKVASFERQSGINAIMHHDFKRTITVTSAVDEQVTSSSSVNEVMTPRLAILEKKFEGLTFTAGGEYEDTDESMRSLGEAFVVALALIFLILATQFQSLIQPLVVMMAIPFGIIGVVAAFYLHGLPLSFIGLVGAIGLSGVVVNDSIVLVDFLNKARQQGMNVTEAAIYAGRRRFRAVWLTTLTTVFGLLPLVYGIGGEDKFLKPAAVALGYGLIFGTVLVLILVPVIYVIAIDLGRVFSFRTESQAS